MSAHTPYWTDGTYVFATAPDRSGRTYRYAICGVSLPGANELHAELGHYGTIKEATGLQTARAGLIVEAFNIASETGRTPRQLAEDRAALLQALDAAAAELLRMYEDGCAGRQVFINRGVYDGALAVIAKARGGK